MPRQSHRAYSWFELVLGRVVALTILFFLVSIGFSFLEPLSPQQKTLFEACCAAWHMGFGAIVALLALAGKKRDSENKLS